jgi:23S rRNA (guanosine2251-2'-O)-methyltransferase
MRFSPRFLQLLREAKSSGVLVEEVTWARLGQISGGAVHQGIVLQPAAAETLDLPSLIEGCRGVGEAPLLIAVDGLTDPQNLGAIVRSAEALGAHGMVLPQRRNAGLTGSVAKVAAGALEHLPVARVVNLNRSLDALKEEGYRVVGLAAEGTVSLEEADLSGPLVVVTGSEGDGLSMLTRRSCDQLVRIPLRGSTPSLNASVATALLLYEIARRGWMHGITGTAPAPRLVRPSLPTPEPMPMEEEEPGAEQPPEAAVVVAEPAGEPVESQVESQHEPQPEPEPEHGPEPVAESESEAAAEAAAPEPSEPPAETTEAGTPADSASTLSSAEEALDLSPWAAAVAVADAFESDIRL